MITETELIDVNISLAKIARLQRDIKAEEIILDDGIENLKKMSLERIKGKLEELEAADQKLIEWIKERKREFTGTDRSKELTWGWIGMRDFRAKPRLMRGFKNEDVAKSLFRAGFKQVVSIKYRLLKNALMNLDWSAERFAKFGITLTQKKNQPFYTINEAKLQEEA